MSKMDRTSVSTISTRVITGGGCHVMRIKGYSQSLLLGTGKRGRSCMFSAAGQLWHISYYPNGYYRSDRDFISLAIDLVDSKAGRPEGHVNAVVRFTLLPHRGKLLAEQAPPQPQSVWLSSKFFVDREQCYQFIRREDLEKSEGYGAICLSCSF